MVLWRFLKIIIRGLIGMKFIRLTSKLGEVEIINKDSIVRVLPYGNGDIKSRVIVTGVERNYSEVLVQEDIGKIEEILFGYKKSSK